MQLKSGIHQFNLRLRCFFSRLDLGLFLLPTNRPRRSVFGQLRILPLPTSLLAPSTLIIQQRLPKILKQPLQRLLLVALLVVQDIAAFVVIFLPLLHTL